MERRKVSTPKEFFESERDRFYSDWTLSFWREFFQNSVDAGAKSIDITVTRAPSRGTFDEEAPEMAEVTRVVIADDGCGMTKDVLEKVYFSIGSTTKKDGDAIGGYGRARLMTCFANVRYSILTKDQFVIGDGPDWVCYDLPQASEEIGKAIDVLKEREFTDKIGRAIDGLQADARLVEEAREKGGHKGCRIEVDLDLSKGYGDRRPSPEVMLNKLRQYLSESQIGPKVTVNGQTPEQFFDIRKGRLQARRGPIRRHLSAMVDGEEITFANVHLSEGERAEHKGKVIVRVAGASMFVQDIASGVQVIIELDPSKARDVMTSNRDGLKREYRNAFQEFIDELVVNNQSALREKKSERIVIEGEFGNLFARRPRFEDIVRDPVDTTDTTPPITGGAPDDLTSPVQAQEFGVPIESLETFVKALGERTSFVDKGHAETVPFREEFETLGRRIRNGEFYDNHLDAFFKAMSPKAKAWVAHVLKARFERSLEATDVKLRGLNDVVVHVENTTPAIKAAIKRNDPRNWDEATGKGRQPRALLVAWTEACAVAVKTLMKVRPSTSEFQWTTGWCYDTAKEEDQGDRIRDVVTRALYIEQDGKCAFLVNPVTEKGKLAFNPSDRADRQRLQALAMHEVAHVLVDWHNEAYAGVLTDLMEHYDFQEAHRRMKNAVKAVYAAYERGKARVQPLDDECGPRPADRLLSLAAPSVAARDHARSEPDGTTVIDCDALARAELCSGVANEPDETFTRSFR